MENQSSPPHPLPPALELGQGLNTREKLQGKRKIMGKIIKVKDIGKNNPEGKESYLEKILILVMTVWIHIRH